ncbi:AraC family transcriptional regulator [Metapseudomonas lalkuanensis]|uniref:AraC family transcriptional regulator n=1 Tax=Metapseudomonas lalkuanensis TaxID=2604832 RepID=UPI001CF1D670|nr:AraC family transcriptional regulator [Pseudomonas lalkuanensis]UCP00674.1 AraC family transcriptional regulator [Pseudomonas lalkuanensis]
MDRLSALLGYFSLHASTFQSGRFCGVASYGADEPRGYVHLLRSGRATLDSEEGGSIAIEVPSLVLIGRPYSHRLTASEADRADLVCATLDFDGGIDNPLARALPAHMLLPLGAVPSVGGIVDWLFNEAFGDDCGKEAILNRLFELMVIQLLRHLMDTDGISGGMLAGLANPRLARAITRMHDSPAKPWSVAELAEAANMSRASFAAQFREVVGITPADYLVSWRVSLAQKRLREGRPIALIADEVGYESPSALARAFRRKVGASPREWLQQGG